MKDKEYRQNWRDNNRDKIATYNRTYSGKNRERLNADRKVWRDNNRAFVTAQAQRYREKNRDVIRLRKKTKYRKMKILRILED